MCIINTGAIVEHDCKIKSFSHIAVGSVVCGGVILGTQTLIGANATIIQNIEVGNNVVIGAGTTLIKSVEDNCMVVGRKIMRYTGGGYKIVNPLRCTA